MDKPSSLQRLAPPPQRLHVVEVVGNAIIGGMERCVERLVDHLGRSGAFQFTVLCPSEGDFSDRMRELGAEVIIVPMPDDPPWHAIQMVLGLLRSRRVDLLHAHLPNAHQLAGLVGRMANVPVMTTIHARQVGLVDLEVHRMVGSHCSVVCQQSYYHALGIGVDPKRLSVEPNGVDTALFSPGPRTADGVRHALGLADEALLVGYVGRLSPEKAPEVFLRAAAVLHERLPDAHFVMVGDGPMRTQLRETIERQGLTDRIHLVGSYDDVLPAFRDLDLLVSSSNTEAMPLGLMEGMACGLPVIATRVGGVPEIVEHGRSGWLVAPRDYEDMAGRMHQMLTQPDLRRRMSARARESMEENRRLDRSLEALAQRMQQLARSAEGTPRRVADGPRAVASRGQVVAEALHQPVQAAGTAASVLSGTAAFEPASTDAAAISAAAAAEALPTARAAQLGHQA